MAKTVAELSEEVQVLSDRVTALEDETSKVMHRVQTTETSGGGGGGGVNDHMDKAPATTSKEQIELDKKHEEASAIIEKHRLDPNSVSPKELSDAHANLMVGRGVVPGQVQQSGQQTGV